ncbi:MAG: VCBS domain-containing protein, partial [Dokdonia sp.]|uniref:VCBS domain-containing protein n=1 Tax=Dokdonia sp. TaxID=2024995 RepID=UPI00326531D5
MTEINNSYIFDQGCFYIQNSVTEQQAIQEYRSAYDRPLSNEQRTVTTVDLNGPLAGVDHAVTAQVGFIVPTVTIDNVITTTSSSLLNARITFSSSPTGIPAGVPDADDLIVIFDAGGTQLGSIGINQILGPVDLVYGSNTMRLQSLSSGVYSVTDAFGAPILAGNLEAFLFNLQYAHNGVAGGGTEGPRYMIVEVTDADNTLSATSVINAEYFPNATDDVNTIQANATMPVSGDLDSNDTDLTAGEVLSIAEVNGVIAAVGNSFASTYGFITVQSNGTYDYSVDTSNIAVSGLRNGTSLQDIISYTVQDLNGNQDFGFITITINGVDDLPVATDNTNSVTVGGTTVVNGDVIFDDDGFGVDSGDRPLAIFIWENQFSAPGGVFANLSGPVNGQSRTEPVTGVQVTFASADPDNIGIPNQDQVVYQTGTNGGHTGYLGFAIDANVNPSASSVLTMNFDNPVVNLSFTLSDIDWSQNDSWQDQMTVTGNIGGTPVPFSPQVPGSVVTVGADTFYGTGSVPAQDAHGNVVINFSTPVDQVSVAYNYGPDATAADNGGQIAAISDLIWQATGAPRVSEVDGMAGNVGMVYATTYGFITINGDGTYTYTLDPTNPAVIALTTGMTLTDTIPYTLIDTVDNTGNTAMANVIITINGPAAVPCTTPSAITGLSDITINAGDMTSFSVGGGTPGVLTWAVSPTTGVTPNAGAGANTGNITFATAGSYTITYTATNNNDPLGCNTTETVMASAMITVDPVVTSDTDMDGNPDAMDPNPMTPTVADDSNMTDPGVAVVTNVLTNDDYLGDTDSNNVGNTTLTDTGTGTAMGTVLIDPDTGEITYTPTAGEAGMMVTVVYQVCNDIDDSGLPQDPMADVCMTATLTITVNDPDTDMDGNPDSMDPNPMAPTVVDDANMTDPGVAVITNVLTNDDYLGDTDPNNVGNTTLTDTGTGTAMGTVLIDPDTGEITYTPTAGEAGMMVTVVYQVCNDIDDSGLPQDPMADICMTATLTITVSNGDDDGDGNPDVSDPNPTVPTVADDANMTDPGVGVTTDVLANDDYLGNNDGPLGTTTLVDLGIGTATGVVVVDPDTGEITYTSTLGEAGMMVTIVYEVCSDDGVNPPVCMQATLRITVGDMDSDGDGVN